ncbi:hypothetical protein [uncultured Campylobacter sp.]|uniref:hypothetical protein n=1 Tax=uncultured Campylobacter sp. TaxID=218934 RepID=UPI0026300A50|nr:hypothetical protein [uncultured Campylobacter sp.]
MYTAAAKFYLRPKEQNLTPNFVALKIVKFCAVEFCSDGRFGFLCDGISPSTCILK